MFFASNITGLFSNEPDVLRWGTSCLQIMSIGFPMYAVGMVVAESFLTVLGVIIFRKGAWKLQTV